MSLSFLLRLDVMARRISPFLLSVMAVALSVVPIPAVGHTQILPMLPLIAVYHWTVYRPELMPAYAVFAIGFLQDVVSGMPLGVNVAVLLIVHMMVLSQQVFLFGRSFTEVWLGFAVVSAGAIILTWLLTSFYFATFVTLELLPVQYILTLGAFPFFAWFFLMWQRAFLGQD